MSRINTVINTEYEAVIGIEVHVELKTGRKIFCSCPAVFGAEPNTCVCPTCLGMPGTLPVLDDKAVEYAAKAGIALHCSINRESSFDRKNYFYPDLPKGYQITQYFHPICSGGYVPIQTAKGQKNIRLNRIHLEEDAGKLIHRDDVTLIDYNRCGVPLIEIVSEPDISSSEEAKAYLNSLRQILLYAGVSDCKMNEGSLRCDLNISLRERGSSEYGTKCEIKNLNSVNFAGRAIEYEIRRQAEILNKGECVSAETRRYNEDKGITEKLRSKEDSTGYRYIVEPNLPPLVTDNEYLTFVKNTMPPLPDEIMSKLTDAYGLRADIAEIIMQTPTIVHRFINCAEKTEYKVLCANLFVSEVIPRTQEGAEEYIKPDKFAEICDLVGEGTIVGGSAKKLIQLSVNEKSLSPSELAERENMIKVTSPELLKPYVLEAMKLNSKAVGDIIGGKVSAKKQLIGAVMRGTGGRADPGITERLIDEELARM